MGKYSVTVAAKVDAYADVVIEAATLEEARRIALIMARAGWKDSRIEAAKHDFHVERDTLDDFIIMQVEASPRSE